MRRVAGVVVVALALAVSGFAEENLEHVEHLRAMMHAMSQHGPVIPQPESIQPEAAVALSLSAHCDNRTWGFSPSGLTVNQGDVVTITISVASNDCSTAGHGFLLDTYFEQGVLIPRGQSKTVTFTATTAGTFPFVCTQSNCGAGHSSMIGQLVVNAVTQSGPTITNVSPASGPTGGGTSVTITGTNFTNSGTTTVTFGGSSATNVNVTSSTTISATTPAHAEGIVDVVLTNNGQSVTATGAFTYQALKVISVSPNSGSTTGGTNVTISGSSFQNGATVTFGGSPATNVTVQDSNTIIATTPLGPATEQLGVDVVVKNPDGSSATLPHGFTYSVPPLTVTSISPATGLPSGGTPVTITGAGFTSAVASSVTFGGIAATSVTIINPITMQVVAPAHPLGTVDVVITVGGLTVTKPGAFTFALPPPRHRAAHH
jgi:plastocyanin